MKEMRIIIFVVANIFPLTLAQWFNEKNTFKLDALTTPGKCRRKHVKMNERKHIQMHVNSASVPLTVL